MDEAQTLESTKPPLVLPKLISIGDLFDQAFEIYRARFDTFFAIAGIPVIVGLVHTVIGFIPNYGTVTTIVLLILSLIITIVSFVLSITYQIALIYAISQPISIYNAYRFAFSKIFPFIWVGILTLFVFIGGATLLYIPGLVFMVWFSLASYVFVHEELRGINALKKSKAYLRGYFWPVFGRFFVLGLAFLSISFALGLIVALGKVFFGSNIVNYNLMSQITSQIFIALFMPYVLIYTYLMYRDIALKKSSLLSLQPAEKKGYIIGFFIFGIIVAVAVVILLVLLAIVKKS
ncbi:MAG: hypothetical protein Q8L47_02440 [bacterium]|nr:hypothetical protein [bacterium]